VVGCAPEPKASLCPSGIFCPEGTQCAAVQAVCIVGNCGNGLLDPGEQCDDGNILENDGCSSTCKTEQCGNGILDPGEVCDDGNTVDGDKCSHDCKSTEVCGNGIKDVNEICDDGNTVDGDGCAANCKSTEICGNNVVDTAVGEVCDDGNTVGGDHCSADCRSGEGCGNGRVDVDSQGKAIEECDDGNSNNNDDCRNDCIVNRCGDGFLDSDGLHKEACDAAPRVDPGVKTVKPTESAGCNLDCTIPSCGDGKVNHSFTPLGAPGPEQCDDGTGNNKDSADCTAGCQVNVCGDNHKDIDGPLHIEICDDGNRIDSDACNNECKLSSCGDGIVGPGEQCDLGSDAGGANRNTDSSACPGCQLARCGDHKVHTGFEDCDGTASCSSTCHNQTCGNGIIDPGEDCDDGNTADNDGCSTGCKIEFCGDGKTNNSPNEACDDGTATQNCDIDCTRPSCGDGLVNHSFTPVGGTDPEQCDPPSPGNGCSALCRFERCGNGVVDPGEQCDDGNSINTDACTNDCQTAVCGDSITRTTPPPAEECDDGNTTTETCAYGTASCMVCNTTCHLVAGATAVCGDRTVNAPNEICDDGNNLACGSCSADCRTVTSANATGLIFAAKADDYRPNGDTFTIDDGVTAVTFELTAVSAGANNVKITLTAGESNSTVATHIASAIGASALLINASAIGSVVKLDHKRSTATGNHDIVSTVATANFAAVGMDGGQGGDCTNGQGCVSALDCASNVCKPDHTCQ
jgi:cysteine-rich repeat protein